MAAAALGRASRPHAPLLPAGARIAVTDREMDEIFRAVPDGTPIDIRP